MKSYRLSCGDCAQAGFFLFGLTRADLKARTWVRINRDALVTASSLTAVLENGVEVVVLMDPVSELFADGALVGHCATMVNQAALTLIVPWEAPPILGRRIDGRVHSFACSVVVFVEWLTRHPGASSPPDLAYLLLSDVAAGVVEVNQLMIRQLPLVSTEIRQPCDLEKVLVMAHRGPPEFLEMALHFIHRITSKNLNVLVGLDEDAPSHYRTLIRSFPLVQFLSASPVPAGPYVVRQELISRTNAPVIVFHDSDDLSCADRFDVLGDALRRSSASMVGSHELRLDEMLREVIAVRFPLDVNKALSRSVLHPLQHPTTLIRRDAFKAAGGFSTDRIFGNDSQFLLRCYFHMQIRNVDEFLYVRRKHPESLTEAEATNLRLPVRRQLTRIWANDFRAVRASTLKIEASSLRPIPATSSHHFTVLD